MLSPEQTLTYKSIKMKKLLTFIKGLAMWTCDVIPGVSGGTIAFITGIYDELLDALSAFNLKTIKLFFTGKRKAFRKEIHGTFLLLVFGGIIIAIVSLAKIITFLLANYPAMVRAFFFGLILASARILKKTLKNRKPKYWIFGIAGTAVGLWVTMLPIVQMWVWGAATFFSWFFAIIAMILPGISGSYILLILSQYQHVLSILVDIIDAVKIFLTEGHDRSVLTSAPWLYLVLFVLGAVVGLLLFSKVLHYIKNRRHDQMVMVLTGFMVGSLYKVWPRKETVQTFVDRHGEIQPLLQKNIFPSSFGELSIGIGFVLVGIGFVLGVMWLAEKENRK